MLVYVQIEKHFNEIVKSDLCLKICEIANWCDYNVVRKKWYECLAMAAKKQNCHI